MPRIEVETTAHEFVRRDFDSEYTHKFEFWNRGDGPLEIFEISASCGCLYSMLSERVIAAGESGAISVSLVDDSLTLSDQTVTLRTNDPIRPQISFTVSLAESQLVELNPPLLDLGDVPPDAPIEIPFTVLIRDVASGYSVTGIDLSVEDGVARELLSTVDEGRVQRYEYLARFSNRWESAEIRETITVRTDVPELPRLELPVKGRLALPYEALPPRVLFGIVAPNATAERTVVLQQAGSEPGRPVRVECDDARVSAELREDGDSMEVIIGLRAGSLPGVLSTSVRVIGADGALLGIIPVQAAVNGDD